MRLPPKDEQVIADATATTTGEKIAWDNYMHGTLQTTGILSGDKFQIYRSNDGSTWIQDGSDITTNAITALTVGCRYLRVDVSAIGGGGTLNGYLYLAG